MKQHGHRSHRSNSSPAAKARQLRRKERNAKKPEIEKRYESDQAGRVTSFSLIITQPES